METHPLGFRAELIDFIIFIGQKLEKEAPFSLPSPIAINPLLFLNQAGFIMPLIGPPFHLVKAKNIYGAIQLNETRVIPVSLK